MFSEEKIKFLRAAEEKQHTHDSEPVGDSDIIEDRADIELFRGVKERVGQINNDIEELDPNDPEYEKRVTLNIEALRTQAKNFELKARRLKDGSEKDRLKRFQKFTEREIDRINLKTDKPLEYQETLQILEDEVKSNPGVRWERIKKWIKDNKWGVLSVTFGVGSFIASIIMAVRNAVKTVAKGTSTFGQSVVKVLKKLGPVFATIGSILTTVLGLLGNGLMFLANNLWILLVLLVMFLWERYFKKRSKIAEGKVK